MKRQAIAISLSDLKTLEKQILKELDDIRNFGIDKSYEKNIQILFPIVNYPFEKDGKKIYASDTWQFESLHSKQE